MRWKSFGRCDSRSVTYDSGFYLEAIREDTKIVSGERADVLGDIGAAHKR